jgi:hypothetical protein
MLSWDEFDKEDEGEVATKGANAGTTPKNGRAAEPGLSAWAPGLPKTRSGKIMRRILRKIATGEYDGLGDISTLADPGVVAHLIETHKTMNVA